MKFKAGDVVLFRALGTFHKLVDHHDYCNLVDHYDEANKYLKPIRPVDTFTFQHCNQFPDRFTLMVRDGMIAEGTKTNTISDVFYQCANVKNHRTPAGVMLKVQEEVGELALEVAIESGLSYKESGKDGILGEAADVIISTIDVAFTAGHTEQELINAIHEKLKQWKYKATTI